LRPLKQGIVELAAPLRQLPLDVCSTNQRATIRQVHELFEIPAQVLVVVVAEEGCEIAGGAKLDAACVGELHAEARCAAIALIRTETDTDFLQHGCSPGWHVAAVYSIGTRIDAGHAQHARIRSRRGLESGDPARRGLMAGRWSSGCR